MTTRRRLIAKRTFRVMAKLQDWLETFGDKIQAAMHGGLIDRGPIQDLPQRNHCGDSERIVFVDNMSASGVAQIHCMYQHRVPRQIIDSVPSDLKPQATIMIQQPGQLDVRPLADAVSVAALGVGHDVRDGFAQVIPKISGCYGHCQSSLTVIGWSHSTPFKSGFASARRSCFCNRSLIYCTKAVPSVDVFNEDAFDPHNSTRGKISLGGSGSDALDRPRQTCLATVSARLRYRKIHWIPCRHSIKRQPLFRTVTRRA
jgi:hypothetical protein